MRELFTINRKFADLQTNELYEYCKSKADIFCDYAFIGIGHQHKYFYVHQSDSMKSLFDDIFEVVPVHELTLNQENYVNHDDDYETLELSDEQYAEIIEDCSYYRHCLIIKNINN